MTDLTDKRSIIQQEETDFRSSVSEAVLTKFGQTNNFIANRQLFYKEFNINGDYRLGAGIEGFEGMFSFVHDFEIVSIHIGSIVPGSSGTTTLDIHLFQGDEIDQGSIFSTKPSIDFTAPANAYGVKVFLPTDVDLVTQTGVTLPVLGIPNSFNAGDAFRIDIDTAMISAENFNLIIGYRPR